MIEIISVALRLEVNSLINMINIIGIWKLLFLSHCSFLLVKLVFFFLIQWKLNASVHSTNCSIYRI